MAGLTSEGLVVATLTEIIDDFSSRLRDAFGRTLDLAPATVEGQFVAILSEALAKLWELIEQVNSSQDPDKATGASLDALCMLTGTTRDPASFSTVTLTWTGTPATVALAGTQASQGEGSDFTVASDVDATLVAATAWTALTSYVAGQRRTNAGNIYQVITDGVSAGSGGPSTTDLDITDGTVHWEFMGQGTAYADVAATASLTGPRAMPAGSVTTIETPVSGVNGVFNATDGTPGSDVQTDELLRIARAGDIARTGSTTLAAIGSDLRNVKDVTAVTVFQNNTDLTNSDGMPPHSVEALVRGGADQDIWDAVLASVAGGIATTGNTPGTALDDAGVSQTVAFSRPNEIDIYVDLDVIVDADFPSDGVTQIKAAIAAFGDAQDGGKNAVPSSVEAQAFEVVGVIDATAWIDTGSIGATAAWIAGHAYVTNDVVDNVGRRYKCITSGTSAGSGGPVTTSSDITDNTAHWKYLGNTIAISTRQLAVFDTSRINVHTTVGTP